MRMRASQGFTLVEVMVAIVIVGVLAGIAVPMFMAQASNAKATEAVLQLEKLARSASAYYAENRTFPQGTSAVLPGADRSACQQKDRMLPVSTEWGDDPSWAALEMAIGEKTRFSYHYQATSKKSAHAWAVADFACNGNVVVYHLYLEARTSGHVEFAIIDPLSKHRATRPEPEGEDAEEEEGSGSSGSGSSSGGSSASSGGSSASSGGSSSASSGGSSSSSGGSSASSGGSSASSGGTTSSSGSTSSSSGSSGSSGSSSSSSGNTSSSSGGSSSSGSSSSSGGSSTSGGSSSSGSSSSSGTTGTTGTGGSTGTSAGSTSTSQTVCIPQGNSGACKKTK